MGGVALALASKFDWLGMQPHPLHRVGALLLVLVACATTYFAALAAMGFDFRAFKRVAR
jgi:putative peptidoglycan lipid II flippase